MGLYLLNISIDISDPYPESIHEGYLINEQESIVEITIEKVLGFENAFTEYDDRGVEDHNKTKKAELELVFLRINEYNFLKTPFDRKNQLFPDWEITLSNGFYQIDLPPPKI